MKNLKKLAKSELKKINGGNAPECPEGTTPCYHRRNGDIPSYWSCEPGVGCPK
ncbi:bacteriocin-like protein [Chryseobacterium sp. JM1]|uniref:bacteriocin-like protein n=1 Tax=Chryseobacterium sp. JM1 TaxID=1233950 RepID=UPI000AFAED0D